MRCWFAGVITVVAGCAGSPTAPPHEAARPAASPVARTSAQTPAPRHEGSGADGKGVLVPSDAAQRRHVLELPASPSFVNAALPPLRPERYSSFSQASALRVGRSHLRQVGLFPGEALLLAVSDDEATVHVYERASSRLVGNYPVPGFRQFETGSVLPWPEPEPRFVVGSSAGLSLHAALTGGLLKTFSNEKFDPPLFSRSAAARRARGDGAARSEPIALLRASRRGCELACEFRGPSLATTAPR